MSMSHWVRKLFTTRRPRPIRRAPAKKTTLGLERMEDKLAPATLTLASGVLTFEDLASQSNNLSFYISGTSYVLNDTGAVITKSGSFPAGWSGFNSNTVVGPISSVTSIELKLGNGTNVLNLRATNAPVVVTGGTGADTFNVSSDAPTNAGNLNGINGTVSFNGGAGTNNLVVSDASATSGNDGVEIKNTTIENLAPQVITYTGTYALVRVIGSNSATYNTESFTINNPGSPLRLDTQNGDDTVSILATSKTTSVYSGNGADSITVAGATGLDTINGSVVVDAGAGSNSLVINDKASAVASPQSVTVNATSVTGFAGSTNSTSISYQALGGTFGTFRLEGSDSATNADTFVVNTLASTTNLTLNANGGNDVVTIAGNATGSVFGQAGNDSITVNAVLTGDVVAGEGDNVVSVTGTVTGDVTAGSGIDTVSVSGTVGGDVNVGGGGLFATPQTITLTGTITGDLIGGAGYDRLNYTGRVSDSDVVLLTADSGGFDSTSGGASGIGGTFTNIDRLTGAGHATDDLTGYAYGDGTTTYTAWNLDGTPQLVTDQTLDIDQNTFANLRGANLKDVFTVSASTAANLFGNDGTDVFNVTAGTLTGNIDAGNDTDTVSVAGVVDGNVNVGDGGLFATPQTITLTGTITGDLIGGAGYDRLNYTGRVSDSDVVLLTADSGGFDSTSGGASGIGGTFTNIDRLTGAGHATDDLTGYAYGDGTTTYTAWNLDGIPQLVTDQTLDIDQNTFANLRGANLKDVFAVSASTAANLFGNDGTDVFNVTVGTLTGNIDGGNDADDVGVSAGATVDGSIAVGAGANVVLVSGHVTGNVTAGSGGNSITVSGTGDVDGNISSGSGKDAFVIAGNVDGDVDAGDGGTSGSKQTVNISGTVVGNVTAGGGVDSVTISGTVSGAAGVKLGGDNDFANVTASGVIGGTGIDGEAGTDTLTTINITFTNAAETAGTIDNTTPSNFLNFDAYVISGTVTGSNNPTTWIWNGAVWTIDGTSLGAPATVQGGTDVDTFAILANLSGNVKGGAGADLIYLEDTKVVTGVVDGEADNDTFSYGGLGSPAVTAWAGAVTVTLTGATTDGYSSTSASGISGTLAGIDTLIGGTGSDTLIGENVNSTWTLAATQQYQGSVSNKLTFSDFHTLTGGSADDTFNVTANTVANLNGDVSGAGNDNFNFSTNAVALTGSIVAGSGYDKLSYAGRTAVVSVVLTGSSGTGFSTNAATGVSGTVTGINRLVGGSNAADALTGYDHTTAGTNAAWNLDGTPTYVVDGNTLDFDQNTFEVLTGGSVTNTNGDGYGDIFTVTADTTASLYGGGVQSSIFSVASGATLSGSITGGAAASNFIVGGVVTGAVAGGSSADSLSYVGQVAAVTVELTGPSGVTGVTGTDGGLTGGFSGIDRIKTSANGDTIKFASGLQDLTAFAGVVLTVEGNSGSDSVELYDNQAIDTGDTVPVAISGSSISRGDALTGPTVYFGSVETIKFAASVDASPVQYAYTVSSPGLGKSITVTSGVGSSTASSRTVNYTYDVGASALAGTVTFTGGTFGGGSTASITLDDSANTSTSRTWSLTDSGFDFGGGPVAYSSLGLIGVLQDVKVQGGTGGNTFTVAASTSLNYTIEGASGDTLSITNATVNTYSGTFDSGVVTPTGKNMINFSGFDAGDVDVEGVVVV